ncbi:glycosyl transferase [Bosea sp. Root670]|uniref:glycosyltransferase family 4 protein n=1 Tax=unclassified Bosea (in: a-proteobacteria) TaxID=2653178 RepID=UPI000715D002|nr:MULTISPECIES: glycosyltransferase family 4 protein [unclassified Bosea (in: a-proteobacteria)]KRE08709.1 glycosyl transferase [Bosea sp. Root670]TQI76098.1 glycosyltransferase involved in cell wall biosynthesis [Bosea sp. AK1]
MSFKPGAHLSLPSTETHPLAGRTILQIIPELEAGGAERTAVDIAKGLTDAGARALVATEGGRLVAELQAKGGVWLPFPAASKNPVAMLLNIRKLALLCKQEGVELIHARSRAPAWVALGAARLLKLPFVTTYHGSYNSRSTVKTLYNSVMARGDVVIANSVYTAGLIMAKHPVAGDRVRVVNRGTNFSAFAPAAVGAERVQALRNAWGVEPHQRIVLLPGRLTNWKGQRVLIEAARIMRDGGDTDTAFILAGDAQGRDGYVKELDALIAKAGLEGRVKRVGHCSDMPAAMLSAAVVAVPSTDPEAFGRVAVEAQAMGTPVVVSDLGAVPETVLAPPQAQPGERTGWRVPPGDAPALAAGLNEALALRPSARDALARRARVHVERHFSLEAMVSETLDVYCALLGG